MTDLKSFIRYYAVVEIIFYDTYLTLLKLMFVNRAEYMKLLDILYIFFAPGHIHDILQRIMDL